ncbi:hypothetical protein F5984_10125 [Rudanella paleaurantiibacter]|uniref:Uncharacterized protein n=1 Tax=Rudanella paleaurantiibacter TaxID=2614655 RepID=A0A7J5U0I4_9BACT|nr:hypothetical protein [Rudanella paleaurantiibacter]KAB7731155.1 hypothetical protein F5984_10125 [Rudanella paleaurantiibacter]
MEKQETPEEFRDRINRLIRESDEQIARMTPEERAELFEAQRSHAEKVRDQITASYEADIRAGRVQPTDDNTPDKSPDSEELLQSE